MEEREILKAIEVIFSRESREDSLQYRYVDTEIITSLGKPAESLICEEPDRYRFVGESVDLMRGILDACRTESQRDLFFGILRQTFEVSSPYHPWAPLAFETLIRLNRPEEALHHVMSRFAATPPFGRLLTVFSENLHYEHHRFNNELLTEVGDWIKAMFTDPVHSVGRRLMAQCQSNRPGVASIMRVLPRIRNQIDEIRFLRLKGELLKSERWEANQDRRRIEEILARLNPEPLTYLREFDREYEKGEGRIDLCRAMGHLRAFMNRLYADLVRELESISGASFSGDSRDMEQLLGYLKGEGVAFFSQGEDSLSRSLMGFISEANGSRYLPKVEFARVGKNMVMEMALVILEKLEAYRGNEGESVSGDRVG